MHSAVSKENLLSGLRILIVEDEPLIALCLGQAVEDEGCVVVGTCATVAESLALIATATFDVAVLDLNLHGEAATEVAAAVLRAGSAIVFATGSSASDVPEEFQAWPVLMKPYSDLEVLSAIAAALGSRPPTLRLAV